jgi:hypothetical protein
VEVALEAEGVQLGDVLSQLCGIDEARATVGGGAAALVQIRVEQRGRPGLGDPVQHQFDRARAEPAMAQRGSQLHEFGDLLGSAFAVPPQGADDTRGERAVPGGRQIRVGRVVHAEEGSDEGVLPGRDAEGVQMALGVQQCGEPVGRCGRGSEAPDELHRAFLERAARLARARGVPLDPSVGGIGRVPRDAGEFQGAAVDPGTVMVPVGQIDRSVGDDGVQQLLRRRTALEGLHRPAASGDPLPLRMRGGVRAHGGHRLLRCLGPGQVALGEFETGRDRVDVRVLEAGQQQPPRQVDHFGPGPSEVQDLVVSYGGDAVAGDGHGGRGAALGGEDGAAGEDEVCVHVPFL